MRRPSFSLYFPLFIHALTLALSLHPPQPEDSTTNSTPILQDVMKEISARQKWNLEEVRFSKLEAKKVRIGSGRSFEVRIRLGKSRFVFVFPDEVSTWRSVGGRGLELEDLVGEVNSTELLDPLVLQGPFDLRVTGDDRLSLSLPMNNSLTGLKRVLVGEGISLEVSKAQVVSLFRSSRLRIRASGDPSEMEAKTYPSSFQGDLCMPLPPLQVIGSASLVAYRPLKSDSHIKTSYLSNDTIQLLPEKCYSSQTYRQPRPTDLLGLKINKLEKMLGSLGNGSHQMGLVGFMNAKLKASGMVRFQLEIERIVGNNDTVHSKTAKWRTKPNIERVWFEVTAKMESEKLKPVMVRKVVPFIEVDTEAWSSLMSNISFTKFPSILVPQEALTLDVKW